MQKNQNLKFNCTSCSSPVKLSLFNLQEGSTSLSCKKCQKIFDFNDKVLIRQLGKFSALCHQIHESEEILGNSAVGIDVDNQQVKVPYKILLTRFNSTLDLNIGGENLTIEFRHEPLSITDK